MEIRKEVSDYGQLLSRSGMSEREVTRAVLYANEYGLKALSGPNCVVFGEPSCGSWNCLNPIHQRVTK